MNDAASACVPCSPSCPGTQYTHTELGRFEPQHHYSHPTAAPRVRPIWLSPREVRVEPHWSQGGVTGTAAGVCSSSRWAPGMFGQQSNTKKLHLLQCRESRADRVLVVSCKTWFLLALSGGKIFLNWPWYLWNEGCLSAMKGPGNLSREELRNLDTMGFVVKENNLVALTAPLGCGKNKV